MEIDTVMTGTEMVIDIEMTTVIVEKIDIEMVTDTEIVIDTVKTGIEMVIVIEMMTVIDQRQ